MEIKNEKIEVVPLTRDEKGERIEPEQAPARRLLNVSDRITLTNQGVKSEQSLPMSVSVEMPAHELAIGMSQPCFSCRHFDQKAWYDYRRARMATADGREEMARYKAELIRSTNAAPTLDVTGEDVDVEFAMQSMGVCRPLTEACREITIVYPVSTCPATLPNSITPFPRCYEPRTSDDARNSTATFDQIMRTAQGRR
jgi:hypothetical protein